MVGLVPRGRFRPSERSTLSVTRHLESCILAARKPEIYVSPLHLAVIIALLVGVIVVMVILARRRAQPCAFCENGRLIPFAKLPPERQSTILAYYRDHEHREPEVHALFVCSDCRMVRDDFSWEMRSWDINVWTYVALCKVCDHAMTRDPRDQDSVTCAECKTPHQWGKHEASGLRFLMPPVGVKVLSPVRDFSKAV